MKYVNTIRRINALVEACKRIPNNEKYDEIYFRICDKLDLLRADLKSYRRDDSVDRATRANRRKQVLLACKLLKVSYYDIIHY